MGTMRVVWHIAGMGNCPEVVMEQLAMLQDCGISNVDVTFLGIGLDWLLPQCRAHGINVNVVNNNENLMHYETLAMLYIEKLAKWTDEPILYFHTKGVSNPADINKVKWRHRMQDLLIRKWQENLIHLRGVDTVGVNWLQCGHPHYSGNFWLANPSWIRRLPSFAEYHGALNMIRYSCEFWIGSAPGCMTHSLLTRDQPFWEGNWRW
jgi:hypothetical protein